MALNGLMSAINGTVNAFCIYNGNLIAAGIIDSAGGEPANNVAQWNGSIWAAFGKDLNDDVNALCVYNGEVYAGGKFEIKGPEDIDYIARWNGKVWFPVGIGLGSPDKSPNNQTEWNEGGDTNETGDYIAYYNGNVLALIVFNGKLYAGGEFTPTDSSTSPDFIAVWDGSHWSKVGKGLNASVNALCVSGDMLYAGGWFDSADGTHSNCVAAWNGKAWLVVNMLINEKEYNPHVTVLSEYNSEVCVLIQSDTAVRGGVVYPEAECTRIIKLNGKFNNNNIADRIISNVPRVTVISCLYQYKEYLYAAGYFSGINGVSAKNIAYLSTGKK
jgi:hypothetical protein